MYIDERANRNATVGDFLNLCIRKNTKEMSNYEYFIINQTPHALSQAARGDDENLIVFPP